MTVTVQVLQLGPIQTNCYLVDDEKACFVIDPGDEPEKVIAALAGRIPEYIVLTHRHFDHIGGVAGLKEATGAPVVIGEFDADGLNDSAINGSGNFGTHCCDVFDIDRCLVADEVLEVGGMRFKVIHTPGHTPGGICLFEPTEKLLFSGDTLFCHGVGRTDLPGGDHRVLVHAIKEHLAPLPDDVVVYPGHDRATTIGAERGYNPMLRV